MELGDPAPPRGPLTGLRVLEIGTLIAAPFATRMLAEFGADVVKVEALDGGDPLRKWRRLHEGTSLWWSVQARNKRSIALDLKSEEGRDVALRLATSADVLVENLRPGALERLGIGWDVVSGLNPSLVMVRISGYGQSGPYRDRPGFGAIGEAMGGIRYTTGDAASPPARMGVSLGDSLASLHGVVGALMALLHVRDGGPGQIVDVSLYESVFNVMESLLPEYSLFGDVRERSGGALPGIAPSNTYRAADGGYVVIAGNSDPIFRRLMHAVGRDDLADDPSLSRNDGRVKRAGELDEAIQSWVAGMDTAAALRLLEQADVPAGRIYSVADIANDPHFLARGMIQRAELADGTSVSVPGIVPKLSLTPGALGWPGPALGEHSDAILGELGYAEAEIATLRAAGAVA